MKVLIALVGGYVLGARAGSRDFDQLTKSVRAIYESEEFDDFARRGAVPRQPHAPRARRRPRPAAATCSRRNDLVERVRQLAGPRLTVRRLRSSVTSRPMPRRPDHLARRADRRLGARREAARTRHRDGRSSYSMSTARPVATARSSASRTARPFLGCDAREVRVDGAVELERIDAVDPVELVAPLHGARRDVPLPAPDVRERLAFAAAAPRSRPSIAWARRCSVMSQAIATAPHGVPSSSNDRGSDSDTDTGMPSRRSMSSRSGRRGRRQRPRRRAAADRCAEIAREQRGNCVAEHVVAGVPEHPFRARGSRARCARRASTLNIASFAASTSVSSDRRARARRSRQSGLHRAPRRATRGCADRRTRGRARAAVVTTCRSGPRDCRRRTSPAPP